MRIIQITIFLVFALFNLVLGIKNLRGIYVDGGPADGDPDAKNHKKCLMRAIGYFAGALYFIWFGFNFKFAIEHAKVLIWIIFAITAVYYIVWNRFIDSSDSE